MPSRLSLLARVAVAAIGLAGIAGAGLAAAPAFADNPVNAVAESDIYEMTQGETLTVSDPGLLLNDSTTSGGELEVQSIQGDTAGLVLASGNKGGFTFTPDPSFNGAATFEYVLIEINTATTSDPTSVVIIVNPAPGEEGNDPDPAPCIAGQPCGGDGTGTAGSGLDDPCAPADPTLPETPVEAPGGAPECPLPPCGPDALPSTPEDAPTCVPVLPPCGPDALPSTPENAPDCIPVLPPCGPDALPSTPENAPDCIPVVPPCNPDALPSTPGSTPECVPALPPCDPDALPSTPENAPDCVPTGDPEPGTDVPCEAGTPGCGPVDEGEDDDVPPATTTIPVEETPADLPTPSATGLAHTGSTVPSGLGVAGLLLLAGGVAAVMVQRRRSAS